MNQKKSILSLLLLVVMSVFFSLITVNAKESAVQPKSAGSVTGYQKVTWGLHSAQFYVNGIPAFCVEYNKTTPPPGTSIDAIIGCDNEVLQKALYYGYNGPANVLGSDARALILTAIAVSDAYIGETATGASAKYDEFYWDIVHNPSKYPKPPSQFKTYLAITSSEQLQDLAFYQLEKNGSVTGRKTSTHSQLTDGNDCYSLAGAEYGIYNHSSLSEDACVGSLVTDANGNTNVLELAPGTYYAKEIKAPKGYKKSEAIQTFHISSEETTHLAFQNEPKWNEVDVLVEKLDATSQSAVPAGNATLEGAEFTIRYYKHIFENDQEVVEQGYLPERTWIFRTDANGIIRYAKEYLKDGDDLFEKLPFGTITIQETKASEGYLLNADLFVRAIRDAEDIYVPPKVLEEALEVRIQKYEMNTTKAIPGTEFEHENPDGSKDTIITDEEGKIVIQGLQFGTHILREVKPSEGYQKIEEEYMFQIDEHTKEHISITIYNNLEPKEEDPPIITEDPKVPAVEKSPKTGDYGETNIYFTLGILSLVAVNSIYFTKKKTKKKEKLL